jgi:hypothetical protein
VIHFSNGAANEQLADDEGWAIVQGWLVITHDVTGRQRAYPPQIINAVRETAADTDVRVLDRFNEERNHG